MEQRGDARNLGDTQRTCWAFSDEYLWQWRLYLATRQNLIAAGAWKLKRPHSIADMEAIAIEGAYEEYQPSVEPAK